MDFFTKNIRYLRKQKGLRQSDFAKDLNVSRATINNYEAGRSKPDLSTLEILTTYFGVSSTELLDVDLEESKKDISNIAFTIKHSKIPLDYDINRTYQLFKTDKDASILLEKAIQLKEILNEGKEQYDEFFSDNLHIIGIRYGNKNPNSRDNSEFFIKNKDSITELQKFIEVYSKAFVELNKAVRTARDKFNLD